MSRADDGAACGDEAGVLERLDTLMLAENDPQGLIRGYRRHSTAPAQPTPTDSARGWSGESSPQSAALRSFLADDDRAPYLLLLNCEHAPTLLSDVPSFARQLPELLKIAKLGAGRSNAALWLYAAPSGTRRGAMAVGAQLIPKPSAQAVLDSLEECGGIRLRPCSFRSSSDASLWRIRLAQTDGDQEPGGWKVAVVERDVDSLRQS